MVQEDTRLTLIEDIEALDPSLKEMAAYWNAERGGRAMPSPAAFTPARLPRELLPYTTIAEIQRDPLDFRFRLIGTGIVEMAGVDRTNVLGSELYDEGTFREALEILRALMSEPRPIAFSGAMTWLDRGYRRFQTLDLPLSFDGAEVDRILAINVFL